MPSIWLKLWIFLMLMDSHLLITNYAHPVHSMGGEFTTRLAHTQTAGSTQCATVNNFTQFGATTRTGFG